MNKDLLIHVLMTNKMHNSYNQFYSTVFCLLYMFRTNLVVHRQEHSIIYCTDCTRLYNTVYYAVLLIDERLDSFVTCRADKKLWNKIDYKNCASRRSLTHCNMMHSTHNVKLLHISANDGLLRGRNTL